MDSKHLEELTKQLLREMGPRQKQYAGKWKPHETAHGTPTIPALAVVKKYCFPLESRSFRNFWRLSQKKSKKHNVSFLIKRAPRTFRCGALSALLRLCRLFVQLWQACPGTRSGPSRRRLPCRTAPAHASGKARCRRL